MTNKQTYWQAHLDAWRQSSLSQAAYFKQHGLSPSLVSEVGNALVEKVINSANKNTVVQGGK
jgi:hypothetical protein